MHCVTYDFGTVTRGQYWPDWSTAPLRTFGEIVRHDLRIRRVRTVEVVYEAPSRVDAFEDAAPHPKCRFHWHLLDHRPQEPLSLGARERVLAVPDCKGAVSSRSAWARLGRFTQRKYTKHL